MTEGVRRRLSALRELGAPLSELVDSLLQSGGGEWETVLFDEENPTGAPWPDGWSGRLSPLQQTLFLQAVRPECLRQCLRQLAEQELGSALKEAQAKTLPDLLRLASGQEPLLILLSSGADPHAAILQFVEAAKMQRKFVAVALGRGQEAKAAESKPRVLGQSSAAFKESKFLAPYETQLSVFGKGAFECLAAIRRSAEEGNWVLIANCHLGAQFLQRLSVLVSDLSLQTPHADFKLLLTTAPCEGFPSSLLLVGSASARAWASSPLHPRLPEATKARASSCPLFLQKSLKLAYEAPKSLQENLLRAYGEVSQQWLARPHASSSQPLKRGVFVRTAKWSLCLTRRKHTRRTSSLLLWPFAFVFCTRCFLVAAASERWDGFLRQSSRRAT